MAGVKVVLCPGPFAPEVSAVAAALAMAAGWRRRTSDDLTSLPLSDGSGGLVDVLHSTLGGDLDLVTVPGPLGQAVPATVLHLPGSADRGRSTGGTAVVDADQVLGAHLVDPPSRPVAALSGTSEGVGRLVRAALDGGAERIVVGAGVGAVHDGGAGVLRGLGLPGPGLAGGGGGLAAVDVADLAGLPRLAAELGARDVVVACAVDEPLTGLHGAGSALPARTGLDPARAQEVDRAVAHLSDLVARALSSAGGRRRLLLPLAAAGGVTAPEAPADGPVPGSRPWTGAGGGTALVLAALGARLFEGPAVVAELLGLARRLAGAELVVTGCGRLDVAALHSGVVPTVAALAARHGIPVVVVAREVEVSRRELARVGVVAAHALLEPPGPFAPRPQGRPGEREQAAEVLALLEERAARLASTWSRA